MTARSIIGNAHPAVRRNWGYWDGVNDRLRGRRAEWSSASTYRGRHPFDLPYGDAYWAGYYGESHPNAPATRPGSADMTRNMGATDAARYAAIFASSETPS